MAITGPTTTQSVADSVPDMLHGARVVREQKKGMAGIVDLKELPVGEGDVWNEISLEKMEAQDVTEDTDLSQNPQQVDDTKISITPNIVGISTKVTRKAKRRMIQEVVALLPKLTQNAIQRKKNKDGLTLFSSATTTLGGAGQTNTTGYISAGARQIASNATEPDYESKLYCVLHGFQIHPIQTELTQPVGTYEITNGLSRETLERGFRGMIGMAEVLENGDITIDSADDAIGAVFSENGIVLVQEAAPVIYTDFLKGYGGGADVVYNYDFYAFGERSTGHLLFAIKSDATAPTS